MTAHELARFLAALASTGNFALACDTLGRAKSGLYKRRARPFRPLRVIFGSKLAKLHNFIATDEGVRPISRATAMMSGFS